MIDGPRGAPTFVNLHVWSWALWFAMLAGLTQAALVLLTRALAHRITVFGRDFLWMSVAADVIVFAGAAVAIEIVARVLPALKVRLSLAAFLFLFLVGPGLVVPRLGRTAALLVCAGLAIQGARILGARLAMCDIVIRRTVWPLAAVSIAAGLVAHFSPNVAAWTRQRSQPAAPVRSPNVILVVLDTVRAQNLSLYGYTRPTSTHLDRFAQSGVTFDRAFSTSPWTLPSHGTLFTGRFPHALSADWLTPLDGTYPTLAETFARRGYMTAGFVGNLLYCTTSSGLDRGFGKFADYPITAGTFVVSSWLLHPLVAAVRPFDEESRPLMEKPAADVSAEFTRWLASHQARPFFAFLNYFDAHGPYLPPAPYDTKFGEGGPLPDLNVRRTWSRREIQRSMDAYDGELAYLDDELGQLFEALHAEHVLDNTLVVVTSDHGEQFGEHGLFDHANSLYRQLLQVPLVVSFPGRVPAGVRVQTPVSLADLPATILRLAGTDSGGRPLPGQSLEGYWLNASQAVQADRPLLAEVSKGINLPDWQPASKGPMQSVIADGMHYIRHSDGREELYDLEKDTAEVDDLAARADSGPALAQSRRTLDALVREGSSLATQP